MKTLRLIAILAFLSQTVFCQTVLPPPPPPPPTSGHITKADSLFNEGNIKEAVAEYKKMYKSNPGVRNIVYNYACALSREGQNDSALNYLNIAISIDPDPSPLIDPDLLAVREDIRWTDFVPPSTSNN